MLVSAFFFCNTFVCEDWVKRKGRVGWIRGLLYKAYFQHQISRTNEHLCGNELLVILNWMRGDKNEIGSWSDHVLYWSSQPGVLIFRYEDLLNNTEYEMRRILDALGITVDNEKIITNEEVLENSIDFTFESDDLFFGFNSSAHETLKESYNDKYEFILPEITLDKSLVNNNIIGNINLQTNLNIHNYDTNKTSRFLVNDFNWSFKEFNLKNGLNSKILGNIKNVNYDSKNIDNYKESTTNELFGAIGLLSEFNLEKKVKGFADQYLTPKFLLRYSPGNMKKENGGDKLNTADLFSLNRLNNINNFENGLNAAIGFDYKIDGKNNDFSFIFQKPIFLDRTVYDNLLYVLKVKNKMKRADEVINKNAQEYKITHLLYRSTRGLSGGEQQIISFIRALIVSPKVIFLDEAFSNLDKLYIDKIEFIINQISKNGIKIIMISHDDNQILRLANQVFNIKDGAIDEKI